MSKIFFSFVHCWFFEESNSVEITLNTFLRLLYKYMVQKLLDLTRALFITTKIHTPRWRLQKFRGNFYFRNHIKRAVVFRDGDTFCKGFAGAQVHIYRVAHKYLNNFLKMGVASKCVKPCLQNCLCFLSILIANFSENLVALASIFYFVHGHMIKGIGGQI